MDGIDAVLARAGEASTRTAALARRLDDAADTTRSVAARVAATADTPWRSLAAGLFRESLADLVTAVRRHAADLDQAGDLLRSHAATAGARADHLAALARALDRAAEEGLDDGARVARDALERALPWPVRLP